MHAPEPDEALTVFSSNYRAVNDRCAVNLDALNVGITKEKILALLENKGFQAIDVSLEELARACIGNSQYKRGSRLTHAPEFFDCSSFTKWLYAERGIWLPRRSIQQSIFGVRVALENIIGGDLIMTSGAIDYFFSEPENGIGHVGIVSDKRTVIHAANKQENIIETDLDDFIGNGKFREARRIIPPHCDVRTFRTPQNREVEGADDMKWIILQNIANTENNH